MKKAKSHRKHPAWATCHRKPGTELRLINGNYYLYEYKTIYDKEKKCPKKISGKLLGSISQKKGFIPSAKHTLRQKAEGVLVDKVQIKEYGFSFYIDNQLTLYRDRLKEIFPEDYQTLIAIAYCRLAYQSPLKSMSWRLCGSWLASTLDVKSLSDKSISQFLQSLGNRRDQLVAYMKTFIHSGEHILTDVTHIFSQSRHMPIAKTGYNNQMRFDPQFNVLYLFSQTSQTPVYYRLIAGNIRKIKAFRQAITESGLSEAVVIADKGFYSEANINLMHDEHLKYILPLRRNNPFIDYKSIQSGRIKSADRYFFYQKRIIGYESLQTIDGHRLFLFSDEQLRVQEEKDYLERIITHPEQYTLDEFHQKRHRFGTLALLSNLTSLSAEECFLTYKTRTAIEGLCDSMKNVLEADRTYMQNEQTLQGWMFINHIALQWYQRIYLQLKDKKLLSKYSVNDCIQMLLDIRKVKINQTWHLAEITATVEKFLHKLELPMT